MSISDPIKLLYEALNLKITIDLENGDSLTGNLVDLDDHMNVFLEDAVIINDKGTKIVKSVFVKGSEINFFILPPALKFVPFLQKKK
ncbi:hypothetical protein TUBRATIS_15040 [Tubulinosema ratisbonensis]|uniref:Sm domain-containing protein n=1 Tax=Tubulinosema ratisbonensis TaxID=291195 RepID=A0A437ALC6_9MICR|nr:hypothetical protein TUBRATIS_15040 [Tubulinosema ratisbonensis]